MLIYLHVSTTEAINIYAGVIWALYGWLIIYAAFHLQFMALAINATDGRGLVTKCVTIYRHR